MHGDDAFDFRFFVVFVFDRPNGELQALILGEGDFPAACMNAMRLDMHACMQS